MIKMYFFFTVITFCLYQIDGEIVSDNYDQGHISDSIEYILINTLYDVDSQLLANVYVEGIDGNAIFSKLILSKDYKQESLPLYLIDSTGLYSFKGKDAQLASEDFYGFKIVMIKDDYIVLNYLRKEGDYVSDDFTIQWNYKMGVFELIKTP